MRIAPTVIVHETCRARIYPRRALSKTEREARRTEICNCPVQTYPHPTFFVLNNPKEVAFSVETQ